MTGQQALRNQHLQRVYKGNEQGLKTEVFNANT